MSSPWSPGPPGAAVWSCSARPIRWRRDGVAADLWPSGRGDRPAAPRHGGRLRTTSDAARQDGGRSRTTARRSAEPTQPLRRGARAMRPQQRTPFEAPFMGLLLGADPRGRRRIGGPARRPDGLPGLRPAAGCPTEPDARSWRSQVVITLRINLVCLPEESCGTLQDLDALAQRTGSPGAAGDNSSACSSIVSRGVSP
jgi:hypothetical protein